MNPDPIAQLNGHLQRNEMLKDSLRNKGVILSEKRSLELHFWAFEKQNAVMLAKALYDEGLLVLALAPVSDNNVDCWNIEAGLKDSVDNLTSFAVVKKFIELAIRFNALYDGWGMVINK